MAGTRDRIVETAAELFRAQGVNGTGVLAILDRARAPRGSLYHHFPGGKTELVLAGLEFESSRVSGDLETLLATDPDPATAVIAFAEALAATLELSDYRLGCPVTTATLELANDDPAVRHLCASTYTTWQHAIGDHLRRHGRDNAEHVAETILAAIEGALILARAHRDADIVRRVGAAVATLAG
jgi:TetR/AcrR family transcriptional regulator, lmrAB and yxaGH operons repressor